MATVQDRHHSPLASPFSACFSSVAVPTLVAVAAVAGMSGVSVGVWKCVCVTVILLITVSPNSEMPGHSADVAFLLLY